MANNYALRKEIMTKKELTAKLNTIIDRRQRTLANIFNNGDLVAQIFTELSVLNAVVDSLNGKDNMLNAFDKVTITDSLNNPERKK